MPKFSDFFDKDNLRQICKHDEHAYDGVDMDVFGFSRFINWIEEELHDVEVKYEFYEDRKQADAVEIIY